MINKDELTQALHNGWGDRLFHYYTQLVDANAVRPQDEESKEWKDMVSALTKLATPEPAPTPKAKPVVTPKAQETNDEARSIAD